MREDYRRLPKVLKKNIVCRIGPGLAFLTGFITPLGRLSTKCETDNHLLCGWETKVKPKNLQTW